jgi:hypothetical protein
MFGRNSGLTGACSSILNNGPRFSRSRTLSRCTEPHFTSRRASAIVDTNVPVAANPIVDNSSFLTLEPPLLLPNPQITRRRVVPPHFSTRVSGGTRHHQRATNIHDVSLQGVGFHGCPLNAFPVENTSLHCGSHVLIAPTCSLKQHPSRGRIVVTCQLSNRLFHPYSITGRADAPHITLE